MPAFADVDELLESLDRTPIAHAAADEADEFALRYGNQAKIDRLVEQKFGAVVEIVETAVRTKEKDVEGKAGVGVAMPPIISSFFRLGVSVDAKMRAGKSMETVVRRELGDLWRMALVEALLEKEERIAECDELRDGIAKPYLRLSGVMREVPPLSDDEVRVGVEQVLGPERAEAVVTRKQIDEKRGVPQYVAVAAEPVPLAAVLVIPPWEGAGYVINGASEAVYEPGPAWERTYFASTAGGAAGDLTFLDVLYVVDRFRN